MIPKNDDRLTRQYFLENETERRNTMTVPMKLPWRRRQDNQAGVLSRPKGDDRPTLIYLLRQKCALSEDIVFQMEIPSVTF